MSGWLDSMLAAKVLIEQGIEVIWLCFKTPFFNEKKAVKAAKYLWIKLIVKEVSVEHLKIVKNPSYGHGKNMNPCIDCHGFMFKKAKEIAKEEWIEIIATGEVLGQRPMSQNKTSLKIVEKISNLQNKILRPLSAKNLDETEYEKQELVDREKLLDFKWKTRKPQMALAKKYWLNDYPTPAGWCKLTTEQFSDKLRTLIQKHPDVKPDAIEFIQVWRHFWINNSLAIITRTKEDAELMQTLLKPELLFIKMQDFPWPHAVVLFLDENNLNEILEFVAKKILKYKKIKDKEIIFKYEFQSIKNWEFKIKNQT